MNFADEKFELREFQRLEGHADRVWGLAWKPATGGDGVPAVLASCSGDKTVRVWEQSPLTGSFQCKAVLEETHNRTVRSCAWSPSGKLLATASFDATTAIWEDVGGDFACISTLEGHENEVKSVSWNASGSLLATCGRDKSVWIWEVLPHNEFDCVSVLQGHTQDVKMVQWHPTVDILFSCSYDNTIKIWAEDGDNDDWHCVQTLNECNSLALSFNATGDKMVSCSDDLTIKIWGSDIMRMQSGDGNAPWDGIIASGAADDAIRLFVESEDHLVDGPSYKLLLKKEKAHDMDVNGVQWSSMKCFLDPTNPMLIFPILLAKSREISVEAINVLKKTGLASASDDGTVKIWEFAASSGHKKPHHSSLFDHPNTPVVNYFPCISRFIFL
ncbi:UNVERIFIED_CONTAM: protein CIA1 [Sesamum calycinum]|uniref:Probable cytosolic iron-sulfur protein assembly protein CIAO1 homolog n=1 Tax=Sesamum calycinum TaxID=2727403 RepID=A0AAW2MZ65_9LAMI